MIRFTKIDHVAVMIPTGQQAAARQFYGQLLQLKEIPGQHPRNAIWYEIADIQLHLVEEESTTGLPSGRHPAFEVESLEAAKAYLQSNGVAIAYTSKIEGRERAFFRDPFGNRVEMIEFDKEFEKV
ncbi:VOC family protein [Chitinophaga rhizosphaerae]|uniref:VOC family protein n=1 Tax=Chitinophaga rhizosphaerae TaxID=1864947 RepID=UPI000F800F07|nr:VOC family protein [Chitinophaga rhizosphaerae]